MLALRRYAETALMRIAREALAREDDARSLIRDLFRSEADLSPDPKAGELRVAVHPMANPRFNRALEHLLSELNAAQVPYPGTTLKLVYRLVGGRTN